MADASTTIGALSLEAKVGQLIHAGIGLGNFETETGWPTEEMKTVLETVRPGALRIYGNHRVTPHFMAQYTNQVQEWAADVDPGLALLISADCEYGTVDIVRHETRAYPALMGRTAAGNLDLARDVSAAIAQDMLGMGLNMNHQPVVDVNTNPDNPVIGVRSPGTTPETVATYATAALEGIHAEDQVAVAKHFPGHGDTELDSHMELPHVTYDRETLERVHLPPFETMIEEGVDCIMTSHIVVECLDPGLPATLSPAILTDLLRDDLGFDGVVVTDAMMMDAIADNYPVGEAAVRAIEAGADLVLTGFVPADDLLETRDAILEAVESGRLSESRIDESVERILALKDRHDVGERRYVDPLEAIESMASTEHEAIAREAYERSFSVLGNGDVLPLSPDASVLLTGIRGVQDFEPHLDAAFGDVLACSLAPGDVRTLDDPKPTMEPESTERSLETLRSVADSVDVAVVTTYAREAFPEGQRRIVEELATTVPVVLVSLGLPNEHSDLPEGVAYVATYVQDRLGLPSPLPDTAGAALADVLARDPDVLESLPVE
ncbi:glycoside hydrolase family 3 protein [Natronosalvus halobius]|uniref:glycoside hydrolase family 3 protein n=1 Tax=Natronosalvus halobius TaxID=2953746 RepID=UPI00209E7418|nr:glycoside hydrolase family 3 protein [Natronosalvus halobius]USZ72421.1 glycoside hydrolase family 3 protein [Natronosalvus halobius]